jgi:hypothetical protein
MRDRLKGGLNFEGRRQRTLFTSKSAGDGLREHDHQTLFFAWLRRNESRHPVLSRFFAIPNGGKRDVRIAMKLKAEGVKPGVLDTCLPVARDGFTGLWIEFKAGRNKLTERQEDWRNFLETEGHKVCICYSWQEAAQACVRYLGLKDYTPTSAL